MSRRLNRNSMNIPRGKARPDTITWGKVKSRYGLTDSLIEQYFPEPITYVSKNQPEGQIVRKWDRAVVEEIIRRPEVFVHLKKQVQISITNRSKSNMLIDMLKQYDVSSYLEKGKNRSCHVTLHIGPTNSGKTHDALQKLKGAARGVYLGPLRLLALEVFDTLNADGVPCNLLTGEEQQIVPNAGIVASTIEMCDYSKHYDVAVIDEAQLIEDKDRGAHWTKALLLIDAAELHVCLAPEAEQLITKLFKDSGINPDIIHHKRLTPLVFPGPVQDFKEIRRGDALIMFSRKGVLSLANMLQTEHHISASCVYGALPPAARREEVRKFESGETDVIVSTDAIGMGLSLSIRRIIFCQLGKFDGTMQRSLRTSEILQIAGRAGRFGKYDVGEVAVFGKLKGTAVENAVEGVSAAGQIKRITIPFPEEALELDYPLIDILKSWNRLPCPEYRSFERQDVAQIIDLMAQLCNIKDKTSRKMLYLLASCPVDTKNDFLVRYFRSCCEGCILHNTISAPFGFPESSLEACENKYKALDIYYHVSRRYFGTVRADMEQKINSERDRLCQKINDFLQEKGDNFARHCSVCGIVLSPFYKYGICQRCYNMGFGWDYDLDGLSW